MTLLCHIQQSHLAALSDMAAAAGACEACALVIGVRDGAGYVITDCIQSANVTSGDPRRTFEIDPGQHLALQRQIRGTGRDILGVWHTHPKGPAHPSETDRSAAMEDGQLWLISSPGAQDGSAGQNWQHRAFQFQADRRRFVPARITTETTSAITVTDA